VGRLVDIKYDMSAFDKIGRSYKGATRIIEDETRTAMTRSVVQIEADAKRRVPTDTHNLQRSITHEVVDVGADIIGRAGTNQPYAEPVEKGRRAGAAMPPPSALIGWLGRHGIDPSLAFVVARSIGRKGIKPRPYLKPAYDVNRLKINRELGPVLMERVMKRIGAGNG
jgi:hypothetical protein